MEVLHNGGRKGPGSDQGCRWVISGAEMLPSCCRVWLNRKEPEQTESCHHRGKRKLFLNLQLLALIWNLQS